MGADLLFKQEDFIFSYRVAGIVVRDGKMLLQRPKNDSYAYIGGHVCAFETSEEALKREFREELHAEIEVERLLAIGEIFFPWGNRACHQIALYYQVSLAEPLSVPADGVFHGWDELDGERVDLDYCWVPLSQLPGETIYPLELTARLPSGSDEVFHFVSRDPSICKG